jgi:hypothetical protein
MVSKMGCGNRQLALLIVKQEQARTMLMSKEQHVHDKTLLSATGIPSPIIFYRKHLPSGRGQSEG